MRVLVVGNGGREHALAAALARSSQVQRLFATRPNAGMARVCEAIDVAPEDVDGVTDWVRGTSCDLVVVGPEAPLVGGLVDRLTAMGVPALGPSAAAARLEGSKRFAKELMAEANIPTAAYASFDDAERAVAWVRQQDRAMVVKADGLAAGKGVIVAETVAETVAAIRSILVDGRFSEAGAEVLLEERLCGPELSVIALVDGETVRAFPSARDHKRAYDGDLGPNTGGMGAFAPVGLVDDDVMRFVRERVLGAAARTMVARGTPFRGFLYAGLMLTPDGPRVLEFNCRMGDPECQPLMGALRTDAAAAFLAAASGRLHTIQLQFDPRPSVCVVLASGGYPGAYEKGKVISGLEAAAAVPGVTVYHAGTRQDGDRIVTSGGRVLSVVARGDDFRAALAQAYAAVEQIGFDGVQYRKDIAASAV